MPTACQNDADYLERNLQNSYLDFFPPQSFTFECYLLENTQLLTEPDVLLFLPDELAYIISITVISFGFALSCSIIAYGLISLRNLSKQKYFGIRKFKQILNQNAFNLNKP